MKAQLQTKMMPVPFHGDTIFVMSHQGEPFTPLRPIVENMGITWGAQQKKLRRSGNRWSVAMMATVTRTGPKEALCIPVRKLAGFLATVIPGKVRPEIRAKIELYQAECDDALWDYWFKGQAVNPRAEGPGQIVLDAARYRELLAAEQRAALPLPGSSVAPDEVVVKKDDQIQVLAAQNEDLRGYVATLRQLLEERQLHAVPPSKPRRPSQPVTTEVADEVMRLHAEGLSQLAIGRRLNRSTAIVSSILRGMRPANRSQGRTSAGKFGEAA